MPDTSAWVEFARASGSATDLAMLDLVGSGARLVTTEPIVMEVLAGARSPRQLAADRAMVLGCDLRAAGGLATYELATEIWRACRGAGHTTRGAVDCLIAAVAIREGVPVLHADRHFDVIARHSALRIHPTS
jgi:predicted nucleic acid-binding protein